MTDAMYGLGPVRPLANLRCWRCGKLLAEVITAPFRIKCRGCHARNQLGMDSVNSTE